MFNFLLATTSSDGIPDSIASGLYLDTESFTLGIIVGAIITLVFVGIVKYAKFLIKDNKEIKEKSSTKESE